MSNSKTRLAVLAFLLAFIGLQTSASTPISKDAPVSTFISLPKFDLAKTDLALTSLQNENVWPKLGEPGWVFADRSNVSETAERAAQNIFSTVFGNRRIVELAYSNDPDVTATMDLFSKKILINRGFLQRVLSLKNPRVLEFILAHELSHYLLETFNLRKGTSPNNFVFDLARLERVQPTDDEQTRYLKVESLDFFIGIERTKEHAEVDAMAAAIMLRMERSKAEILRAADDVFSLYKNDLDLSKTSLRSFEELKAASQGRNEVESSTNLAQEKFVRLGSLRQLLN